PVASVGVANAVAPARPARHLLTCARAIVTRQSSTVPSGFRRSKPDEARTTMQGRNPLPVRLSALETEGEGFEPSIRQTTDNGFRDRRIRPLCHPSDRATG